MPPSLPQRTSLEYSEPYPVENLEPSEKVKRCTRPNIFSLRPTASGSRVAPFAVLVAELPEEFVRLQGSADDMLTEKRTLQDQVSRVLPENGQHVSWLSIAAVALWLNRDATST